MSKPLIYKGEANRTLKFALQELACPEDTCGPAMDITGATAIVVNLSGGVTKNLGSGVTIDSNEGGLIDVLLTGANITALDDGEDQKAIVTVTKADGEVRVAYPQAAFDVVTPEV